MGNLAPPARRGEIPWAWAARLRGSLLPLIAQPLAEASGPYHHSVSTSRKEIVMAKGQMRAPKEKKKPKADKDKPKQMSAYKLSQQGSSSSATPKK
jgi:hypothetical protein